MADRVELAFRDAARRLLTPGEPLLVAVSGGGDSVALLHLLMRHVGSRDWPLTVAHLDHGLRPGSAADRRFVAALSRRLGVRCVARRIDVGAATRRGESPEEGARRVRRNFLLEAARGVGAERIATGHTLDDQAETVLMRLVRGTGPAGLAGMRRRGPGPFVKPLLELERIELRGWLARKGHAYREDPSNRDCRFDRNRLRARIMPLLVAEMNPRAPRQLTRVAERLREDAEFLDGVAAETFARWARLRGRRVSLPAGELALAHRALAGRVARLALLRAGADPRRVGSAHVDALLDLARGSGAERHLPGRIRARIWRDRLIVAAD